MEGTAYKVSSDEPLDVFIPVQIWLESSCVPVN